MTRADESKVPHTDPFALFGEWLAEAEQSEINDPNAMAIATATAQGLPSVRMVLLKGHGPEGFTFFTNAQSRKGGEILANPHAALLFHWKSLNRQIRIEGALNEVPPEAADAYFHSRAHDSQIGSAASDQSRPLPDRQTYLDRVEALAAEHPEGDPVPRPSHWTGFTLTPKRFEFWMDRPNRLHDRRQFDLVGAGDALEWQSTLLYP